MIKLIKDIAVELILKGKKQQLTKYYSVLFFLIDWPSYLIKML